MNRENNNKRFWEKAAKLYTPMQERKNSKLYEELCEIISKYLDNNMKVLELACGTGQLTFPLCKKAANWEATDFSANMLEQAKLRVGNLPVNFNLQDATNLSYQAGSFDTVIIANALHIMPNPDKALTEIGRVLKKGGLLIAPTFVYEGKINKLKIRLMEMIGFRTFHKWTADEYIEFLGSKGFNVISSNLIAGEMLPECVSICRT